MNGRKQSLPSKSQSHGKKLKFLLNVVQLTIWLEWTFLHCIESVYRAEETERYQELIEQCNSDMMKHKLLRRLENSQMKASIPSVN